MKAHQVFISYSSKDLDVAMRICDRIEDSGYVCWIAPRNEQAGTSYGQQIATAIKSSQVVVLVYSVHSNCSEHVLNEVSLSFNHGKKIMPILLDESEMCADMQYFLSRKHHIVAANNLETGIDDLLESLKDCKISVEDSETEQTQTNQGSQYGGAYTMATSLTETLINSSTEYSVAVRRFHEIIRNIPNWTSQDRILSKAKEIVAYSFIGLIGKSYSKLIAISKESGTDCATKFCQESKRIVMITLSLSVFALISKIWDYVYEKRIVLDQSDKDVIRKRLGSPYPLSLLERLDILDALISVFERNAGSVPFPIPEMSKIHPLLKRDGSVYKACSSLSAIGTSNLTIADCQVAESALTEVLKAFNFYMRYNIVSMKWSVYEKNRMEATKFLHRYIALGLDNKANLDLEKVNFTDSAITTDSVVMFVDDISDADSINLYPLAVDLNTLHREHGTKICFFNFNPMTDTSLEYVSLDDNSTVMLDSKKIKQKVECISDLFASEDDLVAYNTDNVIDSFNQMQQCLLGESYVDFGDL